MTTMDSDSESQDSDEGRRFRFEATRKDAAASLQSRRRRSSPSRTNSERRSRSRDRFNRDHRDLETLRQSREEQKKELRNSSIAKRTSKERDTNQKTDQRDNKHSRDSNDSKRSSSRYQDSKDTKNLSIHKDSKDSRESKGPRKDSRNREHDRRRSHECSTDRSHDDKPGFAAGTADKYTNKFRDRSKRYSRERSRDRSNQGSRTSMKTSDFARFRDEVNKAESLRKISKKDDNNDKNEKNINKPVDKTAGVDSNRETKSRSSTPSARQECKDLNLSDFDIVSDTEGNCSDSSGIEQVTKRVMAKVGENSLPICEYESRIKKRVSKQQYERLMKRQAVKNRRNLEELHKVNPRNGDQLPGPSNNRSAVSDFLLGTAVSPSASSRSAVSVLSVNNMDELYERQTEIRKSNNNENDAIDSNSDNSQSNSSTYGPALPPSVASTSSVHRNEANDKDCKLAQMKPSNKNANFATETPITPRIIGPTLPTNFRQHSEDIESDFEDTFGPALPPHLTQNRCIEIDPGDEEIGPVLPKASVLSGFDSEDDDDPMGPLPADHPDLENDLVQQQLEYRARRLKAELAECDKEDEKRREEWMTELPPVQAANLGLGPRKFRVRPAPDMSDRSSWTDTPADRARKHREKLENKGVYEPTISKERHAIDVNNEPEKSKKRQKSLLEIHQKKLHKKKKKEEKEAKKVGKTIRRPFDRDVDLQANRFDESRKKSMFLKARELDDRFSRGNI